MQELIQLSSEAVWAKDTLLHFPDSRQQQQSQSRDNFF